MSGTAEWTVDDETFVAEPGMAIYHAPCCIDGQHGEEVTPHSVLLVGTERTGRFLQLFQLLELCQNSQRRRVFD
jgi:hypothetical protein